ncbi:SAM-dependent methyltransferase [Streptomyces sp. NBC_01506]|uniref:SAM-dependent methyltransferase n=1 Tax=Streptomyces sp. NBC_01506 TaxID=2903887 RepID=UPI0038679636
MADNSTVDTSPVDSSPVDLKLDQAHSARMYDYYLGGTTNFPADREAAGKALAAFPAALSAARINRRFMRRATRFLAQEGMTQFFDIGTGIPTSPNLHEVAQEITPAARVVYTDNDPIVLAHARALLHSHADGHTSYAQADVKDPAALLATPGIAGVLDFDRPIALSLNALLHFVTDESYDGGAQGIVDHLKAALPAGSTLAITHFTPDFDPVGVAGLINAYRAAGTSVAARTQAEIARLFDGWELLDPGVVPTQRWRPTLDGDTENVTDAEAGCYAGIARKP